MVKRGVGIVNDEDLKKGFKEIFKRLSEEMSDEDKKSPMFALLEKNIQYIDNPDEFNTMVVYPIKRVAYTFLTAKGYKNFFTKKIYTDYDFFEDNLAALCSQLYGTACSVDKARFLLKAAVQWKEKEKMPVFNWKQKYTFHYPETGSPKQWMDLIEGLGFLLTGNNKQYLLALQSLMKTHEKKRKVKK